MKHCPSCRTHHPDDFNHCPGCGGVLIPLPAEPSDSGGITMGDDNVIAGDVLGAQSNYYGQTTINQTLDDTKRIETCHVCGGPRPIVEGYYCPGCGKFTCRDDFLPQIRRCVTCADSLQTRDQVAIDDVVFPPEGMLSLFERADAAAELTTVTNSTESASAAASSRSALETHLLRDPGALFGKPLFTIGGSLSAVYVYIEAGVRLQRFEDARETLHRIGGASPDYRLFSRLRLFELAIDQSLLTDAPDILPAYEAIERVLSGDTEYRYLDLLKRYHGVAAGQATVWRVASTVDTKPEQLWLARKRATLAKGSNRRSVDAIGAVGKIEFSGGRSIPVIGPVKLGRHHQPALLGDARLVSRNHAELTVTIDGTVSIRDTGSKNGTSVNDRMLTPYRPVELSDGDTISLADVTGVFYRP